MARREVGICAAAAIAVFALSSATISQVVQAHPKDARLALFDAGSPDSTTVIDYAIIDRILEAFVIDHGNSTAVRYSALKGDGLRVTKQLFAGFEGVNVALLNSDEQLAYWLNLRLLMVLHATGEAFPAAKPEQLLTPGGTAFTTAMVNIQGVSLSIADVDQIILSKARSNPHIVYGLLVPVKEAPAFPKVAFRGATVHAALGAAGRTFVNRRGAIKVSRGGVTIPRFLATHRARLGPDDAALLGHIRALAAPKFAQELATTAQLSESNKLTLNNFVERNFSDFTAYQPQAQGIGGGAGS